MQCCKGLLKNLNKQFLLIMLLMLIITQSNGQGKQKCFEDDGLKYKIVVTINFLTATQVNGVVTSAEQDSDTKEKADFIGTIKGRVLNIRFKEKPPVVGNATQWRSKPWLIKKDNGKETLCIIFYSKNYDTKKWGNTTYKFVPCQ